MAHGSMGPVDDGRGGVVTVGDELYWARGHFEHLREEPPPARKEHVVGVLNHLLLAVEELTAAIEEENVRLRAAVRTYQEER